MAQLKNRLLPQVGTDCDSVGESLFGHPRSQWVPSYSVGWGVKTALKNTRGKSRNTLAAPAILAVDFCIIRGLHTNLNAVLET